MTTLFKLETKLEKLQKQFQSFVAMKMRKQAIASLLKILGVEKMIKEVETKLPNPHRQSVIIPTDYEYVCILECSKYERGGFLNQVSSEWIRHNISELRTHQAETGGKFYANSCSNKCDICGTSILTRFIYHNPRLNQYIRVGETCADKIDHNAAEKFRFQKDVMKRQKGYPKATELFKQANLTSAFEQFKLIEGQMDFCLVERDNLDWKPGLPSKILVPICEYLNSQPNWLKDKLTTLYNVVKTVVNTGKISESQVNYIQNILDSIDRMNAKIESEKSELTGTPFEGRGEISGQIISTKIYTDSWTGKITDYKMLILDERKFKVWVTIPANIAREYEDKIESLKGLNITLSCTLKSTKDKGFAYGSRPSKAELF